MERRSDGAKCVPHKDEDLNNDDDASMYGHSDSFMVELRIDVFQN